MLRRAILSFALALYVLCAGAATHVNDSGTWRQLQSVHVNDSGTWRTIQQVYVNDAGTWRTVFQYLTAQLVATGYTNTSSPATFRAANDGNIYAAPGLALKYAWLVAGTTSDFEIRVTPTSGSFSTGTTGAWLALTSTHDWTRQCGAGTFQTVVFDAEIRRVADGSIAASASIGLTCDRT